MAKALCQTANSNEFRSIEQLNVSRQMRILDRYLLKEVAFTWGGVTSILMLVTFGTFLSGTLKDVARGAIPAQLLFSTMGLRSIETLTVLLPLSLFLAILLSFGRLYRDSEMSVLSACGYSRFNLYRPVAWLALPGSLILLVLALWVSPWAAKTSKEMVNEAARTISVAGLQAGRFHEIANNDGVVYVETISDDGDRFTNAFIHSERNGRKDVITAKHGFQYVDPDSGARYLALFEGFRSEGMPGQGDYRWMRFERNDIRLPESDDTRLVLRRDAYTLAELRATPEPANQAEIHWRLAPALAAIVLCALAVPLSRTTPRQGFYGNLIVAVLLYVIYANLLGMGKSWLQDGTLPIQLGLWWVHLSVALLTLWLLRGRRPRSQKQRGVIP
jgi:lipopolysaccharide export system permease protein